MEKVDQELQDIYDAIDAFAAEMKARMEHKYDEGYEGWDEPYNWDVHERLLLKAAKMTVNPTVKDAVDIANFAMMLHSWWKRID